MKTHAWRREQAVYPFQQSLQVRHSDIDTERHINNVALKGLHAEIRMRYLMRALGPQAWYGDHRLLRPSRLVTNFFQVTHYPAPVMAGLRPLAIDREDIVFATALFQAGRCTGVQETRLGAWENGLPVPLSVGERAALAPRPGAAPAMVPLPDDPVAPHENAADYPFAETMPLRYGDLDADWCIAEQAVLRCIEQARSNAMFGTLDAVGLHRTPQGLTMLLASKRVQFLSYRRAPDSVQARVAVGRIGSSSCDVSIRLMDGADCIACSDGITVFADPATSRPVAIPPLLREALQRLAL